MLPCVPALAALARSAPPRCGRSRLLCVDGPAGSGKTTLAGALADELAAAPAVHLDDLYEGWDQEFGAPLVERIEGWLLRPWAEGRPGRYRRYDWQAQRFGDEWTQAPAAPFVMLEGCASASRRIRAVASLVVWVEVPADLRLRRGLERDGSDAADLWADWQAREAAHFAADATREAADVVVDGQTGRGVRWRRLPAGSRVAGSGDR